MAEPPPVNPLEGLVAAWREQAAVADRLGQASAAQALAHCAEDLHRVLSSSGMRLPDSLAERLFLAVHGGYLTLSEAQHLVSVVSCLVALADSPVIPVRAEAQACHDLMFRQSGGGVRVLLFARSMLRDMQAQLQAQSRPAGLNGGAPHP